MKPPSALQTIGTLAAITLTRTRRGRTLWIGAAIAVLPVVFAIAATHTLTAQLTVSWGLFVAQLVLAVVPALFVAASVGEELDDKTTTYLWSRPLARWTILAGKLLALAPIVIAMVMASWIGASLAAGGGFGLRVAAALGAGALGGSIIAAAIATLVPKHGMALAIFYMMFIDLPIGALPASLQQLSVSYHVRVFADLNTLDGDGSVTGSAIALAVVSAIWAAIALWRIRRLEA